MLGHGAAVDDAVQEASLRAWRRHHQCHSVQGRRAWVTTIARNEALRIVTGARAEVSMEETPERAEPDPRLGATVERLDVWQALGTLEPAERRLIGLRYWADLTQAEAAERLDLPEGTAKVRLHRLRATLRTELAAA